MIRIEYNEFVPYRPSRRLDALDRDAAESPVLQLVISSEPQPASTQFPILASHVLGMCSRWRQRALLLCCVGFFGYPGILGATVKRVDREVLQH